MQGDERVADPALRLDGARALLAGEPSGKEYRADAESASDVISRVWDRSSNSRVSNMKISDSFRKFRGSMK